MRQAVVAEVVILILNLEWIAASGPLLVDELQRLAAYVDQAIDGLVLHF